jgi:protein-S-isoprenylcysteine O-methyltransferase Ste14
LLIVFVLLAISVLVTFPLMIHLEEQELEQRFGESYRRYKSTVPLLPIPLLHLSGKRSSA